MKALLLISLAALSRFVAAAQLPDSIKHHIDTALVILKTKSLYSSSINWVGLEKEVYQQAQNATTKTATFPALTYAFQQLADHHGLFAQYDDQYRNTDSTAIQRYSANLLSEWKKGWKIQTAMMGTTAYLRMPTMQAFNQQQILQYANLLSDSIAKLVTLHPKAWILDMRLNAGGNIVPMLAGLAPFFANGIVSWYIDKNNQASEPYALYDGQLITSEADTIHLNTRIPAMPQIKIAVLIGAGTGSSGEITAAILQQRSNTRLFGEASAGQCNSTEGFVFNGGESYFLLTTQHIGNKQKKPLPHQVKPATLLTNNDLFTDLEKDHAVIAALAWLH